VAPLSFADSLRERCDSVTYLGLDNALLQIWLFEDTPLVIGLGQGVPKELGQAYSKDI